MKQDNFKNRYILKIGSSIIVTVFNMIVQVILPRAFSVGEYGFYTYNLNVFTSVVVMANLSTSNALVAKFSKRNNEIGLVNFYLKYYICISILLNIAIILLYPAKILHDTFAGQSFFVVLLGIETALINKLFTDCISIYDASAISRFPAFMHVLLKAVVSLFVIGGYLLGRVNLIVFYVIQVIITSIIVIVLLWELIKDQKRRCPAKIDLGIKNYCREYIAYCQPLVLANVIAQIIVILMNWALMKWSGATEQAVFGVAWQLNTLVSYVFSPYAELSKREFAVICDDEEKLKHRFIQALKLMIWLTSYFAIFIVFMSEWILPIVYGDKYSGAEAVAALIMMYTIYQAWGQISGSYMLALEKTKGNAIISIIGQLLTFGFVFLFQIPNFIWPGGLGAVGIALNYLVTNIITTSISIGYISKTLKISCWKTLMIQFPPIIICTVYTLFLRMIMDSTIAGNTMFGYFIKTIVSGIFYTIGILSTIYIKPELLGISKGQLVQMLKNTFFNK